MIVGSLRPLLSLQYKPSPQREEKEMTEENTPQTPEQLRRLNRALMEKVIDKAASDEQWKQRLLDDPEAAMAEAGFPEAERLRGTYEGAPTEEEVIGQVYESPETRAPIYRPDPREDSVDQHSGIENAFALLTGTRRTARSMGVVRVLSLVALLHRGSERCSGVLRVR